METPTPNPTTATTAAISHHGTQMQQLLQQQQQLLKSGAPRATDQVGPLSSDGVLTGDDDDFITIVHFNDCYNIEPGPESSGAAGFLTGVNQFRHLNPIILFSGDILSPSFMSTFTKGEQMIPVLNDIGVHCAVFGNHEFDYGVDNLIEFTRRTTFPWLLSNVVDKETSNQLGDGRVYHIIERAGLKLGLIGLIEEEWLSTLSTLDSSDVIYEDFVVRGRELARWLKFESRHQVDFVIALTHFRTPNDIRLADAVPEIDLILGGHDHDYEVIKRPNCYVIKSGTDFREFSLIKLKLNAQYIEMKKRFATPSNGDIISRRQINTTTTPIDCCNEDAQMGSAVGAREKTPIRELAENHQNSEFKAAKTVAVAINETATATATNGHKNMSPQSMIKPIKEIDIKRIECLSCPPDESLKAKLDKFVTSIDEKMGKVLGQFNCELDGRFSSIRKYETNLGNFVCDIMLASTHADLAILNSGTLRSDRIHPRGDFTMRDLFNILGYIDPIAVLHASGHQVWLALENGVSQWPKLEGRFPQISGCSFVFDPAKPPLQRIDPSEVQIGDEPLDLKRHYKLTTKAYLASGKDGYDVLKECEVLVPGDESPDLTTSILNHFEAINILKSNRRTHHRQSLICLSRSSIKKLLDKTGSSLAEEELDEEEDHHHDHNHQHNHHNRHPPHHNHQHDDEHSNFEVGADGGATRRLQTNNGNHQLSDDNNDNNNNNNNNKPTDNRPIWESSCGSSPLVGDESRDDFATSDQIDGDATGALDHESSAAFAGAAVAEGPSASSPLVGLTAPPPARATLESALWASSDEPAPPTHHDGDGDDDDGDHHDDQATLCNGTGPSLATPPSAIPPRARQPRSQRVMSLYEMEFEQCKLEPKVEGRIKILGENYQRN